MSMNLTITNNTGFDAYYMVWGFADGVSVDDAPWSYMTQSGSSSVLTPLPVPAHTEGASKSLLPEIAMISGTAGENKAVFNNIPHLISGNVFFSFKQKPTSFNSVPSWVSKGVPAKAHNGYGVQPPDYHPGAADADTIFSSAEFTLDNSGVWADTTNVDYFAAPITVTVNGSAGTQTSGTLNPKVTRNDVFTAFKGLTDPKLKAFSQLVMTDTTNVRILAPGHGIESGLFSANYFDEYLNHCLGLYTGKDSLVVTAGGQYGGTYKGTVSGNTINFDNGAGSFTLTDGNSKDIFLCDGQLAAPNNKHGAVAAVLGAALNRTVLHLTGNQPYCKDADFYVSGKSETWWATNWYSKLLHDEMSKVYGFAFDDVCDNNETKPLLHDPNPTAVEFTLENWG